MRMQMPVPTTGWLPRESHRTVVELLNHLGLIKFSNDRNLPLKNGGQTDIYVNLRNARSNPAALAWLTELYSYPLRWLNPKRFVEVPESISCIAGTLSMLLDMPFITIRGEVKEGRVSDSRIIGDFAAGERLVIIDDVITDGRSKTLPYLVCEERGLEVEAFVVFVDRQQGWKKDFIRAGVRAPVWAGMTLHDVRRELVALGEMEVCSSTATQNNRIIVALDNMSWEQALRIVEPLRTTGSILKVNDLLHGEGIEHLMPELSVYGRVMADLKLHDIPNTVANVCKRFLSCTPWALTVHASGGKDMVRAAKEVLGGKSAILAITLLTSIDPKTCEDIYRRRPLSTVKKLAQEAHEGGADGFVCSALEVATLREMFPNALLVVPGTRSPGVGKQDQKRTNTPEAAIKAGADFLVIGRQITEAADPVAEFHRLTEEELVPHGIL